VRARNVLRGWRFVAVWLLSAFACSAAAQSQLQASVDRPVVRDNESFTYIVRADGAVRGEPEEAALAAQFDILQRSSSSRVQIIGGQTAQVTEWQYQLMPKAAGEFTIPSLRVGNLETNAVTVRVLPPDTSGSPVADIFMELEAQPTSAYVQSQVVFTLRLFVGVAMGRATLTAPETSGVEAIVEKLGEDSSYQTTRGGRSFIVRERRYVVFPQEVGTLTIGPATFEAMVIPDRGFSRVQRFRSSTVELTVQPAVPPPAALAGAAWLPAHRIELTETWSDETAELAVGVPRTRKIVVEGLGLLETQLPDVPLAQQPGVRQYADQPELSREITADGLLSRRSVSLAVIAQASGEVELGGVQLPWFNVDEARWEVAELPPRTLVVAGGGETPPPQAGPAPAVAVAPTPVAPRSYWPFVSGAFGVAWLVTLAAWWLRSRGRAARVASTTAAARPAADRLPSARKLVRELESVCAVRDAAGARRVLLEFAAVRFAPDPPRSLGALAAVLPDAIGREVLALEAHIYGAAPSAEWDSEGLKAVLGALLTVAEAGEKAVTEPLLPLYR
jgi:hypothetical protein